MYNCCWMTEVHAAHAPGYIAVPLLMANTSTANASHTNAVVNKAAAQNWNAAQLLLRAQLRPKDGSTPDGSTLETVATTSSCLQTPTAPAHTYTSQSITAVLETCWLSTSPGC
jgi:hypothetical protein